MSGLAKLVASALSIPLGFAKEVGEHLNTIETAAVAPKEPKPIKVALTADELQLIEAKRQREAQKAVAR